MVEEERDGMFHFKGNLVSILPGPFEPSHKWFLTNFKYQGPELYDRIFDESDEGTFEVPPGITNILVIRKPGPGSPKMYVF